MNVVLSAFTEGSEGSSSFKRIPSPLKELPSAAVVTAHFVGEASSSALAIGCEVEEFKICKEVDQVEASLKRKTSRELFPSKEIKGTELLGSIV